MRVDVRALQEDPVLNLDGVQVARANAQECVRGNRLRAGLDREGIRGLLDREQCQSRGEQILLPRVRPDGVAEIGSVVAALEPIRSPLLLVRPADGQLLQRAHLVEDDRPLRDRRPDDRVALLPEPVDDPATGRACRGRLSVRGGASSTDPGIEKTSGGSPNFEQSMTVNIQQLHPSGLQTARKPRRESVASGDSRAGCRRRTGHGAGRRREPEPWSARPSRADAVLARSEKRDDQPNTSPGPTVRMVTRPRPGTVISMATRPSSTT